MRIAGALVLCCALAGTQDYTVADFTQDCRLSGAIPQLFDQSVACDDRDNTNIHCLRAGQNVHGCTLGPSQSTEVAPSSNTSHQRTGPDQ